MEWNLVKTSGTPFTHEGKTFYDMAVGPSDRRAVIAGVGALDSRYGFIWFYRPRPAKDRDPGFNCNDAAKVLVNQFRFSLIDYRSLLLAQGKLTSKGEEAGFTPCDRILDNRANRGCLDREYAA